MKKTFEALNLIHNGRFVHLYEEASEEKQAFLVKRVAELTKELEKYKSKNSTLYMYFCNITTSIACLEYDTSHGMTREDSLKEIETYMQAFMAPTREKYRRMFQKKWLWPFLRLILPQYMCQVNGEGFHCYTRKNKDRNLIVFYTDRCMFQSVLKEKNMLDLAKIFCAMDEYMYGNIPGVKFVRLGTLCIGAQACDFQFVREKKRR